MVAPVPLAETVRAPGASFPLSSRPVARYSLSALGVDRPGIVAGVSGALVDFGCNLEDSTMTILQGHFAILLVVSAPSSVEQGDLEGALAPVAHRFGLTFVVRELPESVSSRHGDGGEAEAPAPLDEGTRGDPWVVSVHGADRPGIVHAVTAALADGGGNVVDLSTHLLGDQDSPVYVMTLRALLPPGDEGRAVADSVLEAGRGLDVRCTVHRDDADIL
jgi:glycine cleavage system transcriptional repressor